MTAPGAVDVFQITDTHLFEDADSRLLGLDTDRSLAEVVRLAAGRGKPELVVASGDLAHDGSAAAYHKLRQHLSLLDSPVYCLPGNHDEGEQLRRYLNHDGFHCCTEMDTRNGWKLLFLDSTVAGSEGGTLAATELQRLSAQLAKQPDRPTLVWLHHQPRAIDSAWLDTMAVTNGEEFLAIVDACPQVRAVVWGHVHQEVDELREKVRLLASPSTCVQFKPHSRKFALDQKPPGYRWLRLHNDGGLETGVERLEKIPGTLDFGPGGY